MGLEGGYSYKKKKKYICKDCGTVYYTTDESPPPSPKWSDGHVCKMVLEKET